jgi:hypothetical protein
VAIAEIVLDLEYVQPGGTGTGTLVPTTDYSSALPYSSLITSEHNKQPNFMSWVVALTAAVGDINAAAQAVNGMYNLNTATGIQLDIVGQWVGQARVIPNVIQPGFFGFSDTPGALGFGEHGNNSIGGRWFEYGALTTANTTLSDPDYRTIIRARIVRNQSNGTVAAIENALAYIFNAQAFVTDSGNYTLNITVLTPITPVDQALLTTLDLLPRPAGMAIGTITFNSGITVPPQPAQQAIPNNWNVPGWNAQHQVHGLHYGGN